MNDWLTVVLPIVNATGIPLLALGIVLLLRAYQKSTETYKDTTIHLKDENERLRQRLSENESSYYNEMERAREIARKSIDAIQELQALRAIVKVGEKTDNSSHEIEGLDSAIEILRSLSTAFKILDMKIQEHILYSKQEFELLVSRLNHSLIDVERELLNDKGRQVIGGLVTTIGSSDPSLISEELRKLKVVRGEGQEQELKKFLIEQQTDMLKELIERGTVEEFDLMDLSKRLLQSSMGHLDAIDRGENPLELKQKRTKPPEDDDTEND